MRKINDKKFGNCTVKSPVNMVNIRYKVDGYHFDAVVDIDWELHAYEAFKEKWENTTAIEIFNLDVNWDIKMIYQNNNVKNSEMHTFVDMDNLIEETRKWIEEMKDVDYDKDLNWDNGEDENEDE